MSDSSPQKFPPGPPSNLIRSLFGAMQQNPLDYFTAMAQKYGDVSGMRIGKFRSLFINHPDLIEDVLVNNARLYYKGRILRANKYLFGEGLLTSEGDFWLRQRRLAQPAFQNKFQNKKEGKEQNKGKRLKNEESRNNKKEEGKKS